VDSFFVLTGPLPGRRIVIYLFERDWEYVAERLSEPT
jgi:hypothetical protein